jgi:hypothetical protein
MWSLVVSFDDACVVLQNFCVFPDGAVVDAPPHANAPASPLAIVMEYVCAHALSCTHARFAPTRRFVGDTLKRRIALTRGLCGTLSLHELLGISLGLVRAM